MKETTTLSFDIFNLNKHEDCCQNSSEDNNVNIADIYSVYNILQVNSVLNLPKSVTHI